MRPRASWPKPTVWTSATTTSSMRWWTRSRRRCPACWLPKNAKVSWVWSKCVRCSLGYSEHLTHFDHTHDTFAFFGSQHAGQRRLDLVHHRIDDVVVADVHTVGFGQLARGRIGTGVEADQ